MLAGRGVGAVAVCSGRVTEAEGGSAVGSRWSEWFRGVAARRGPVCRRGLAILEAIRRQKFDVWSRRPVLSKFEKLRLAARLVATSPGTYPGCPS